MYIIFRFILLCIHFIYSIYFWTKMLFKKLEFTLERLVFYNDYYLKFNNCPSQSVIDLTNKLTAVSKFPKHVAVIFGHEKVSFADIARFIGWCVLAEIPCISFYDHTGTLVKDESFLRRKLYEIDPKLSKKIKWLSNITQDLTNSLCDNDNIDCLEKNYPNGNSKEVYKYKIRIKLLSNTHGKQTIATLTKNLAQAFHFNGLKISEINTELIDEKLGLGNYLPEPDIGIVLGKTMSTYSYLPWHIRVTEFFLVPTQYNLCYSDFVDILIKYGKCEQRYGK